MSIAAKCYFRIEFKEGTSIPLGMSSRTALHQSLLQFYKDTSDDKLAIPSINIVDFDTFDKEIEMELYSSCRVNLDFQADLLRGYLEVKHDDIIEEVNEDKWQQIS